MEIQIAVYKYLKSFQSTGSIINSLRTCRWYKYILHPYKMSWFTNSVTQIVKFTATVMVCLMEKYLLCQPSLLWSLYPRTLCHGYSHIQENSFILANLRHWKRVWLWSCYVTQFVSDYYYCQLQPSESLSPNKDVLWSVGRLKSCSISIWRQWK